MSLEVCVPGSEGVKNLGKTKCTAMPKLFKRVIEVPLGWYLDVADYATAAALKIKMQALLKNPISSRGYLYPPFVGAPVNNSEESSYETTPFGRIPIRDGQRRYKHFINAGLCVHKALQSHRKVNDGAVIYQDVDNQLLLTEPFGDGKLYPLTLALLWTEKMEIDGTGDASSKSPFVVDLADSKEIDKYGVLIDGSIVNSLFPLTDATIKLTDGDAFAAAEFFVDVFQSCDKQPILGLELADFLFLGADGITVQVIDSADEDANHPGRYHIVAPGGNLFEDGTLTLVAPSALSIDAYEVDEPLVVNIP
jgi:hypothetical protein